MKFEEQYALTNVSVVDGNGGAVIKNAAVVVSEKKIEKVCRADEVGSDMQIINLEGKYVMPGFIDAHVHLTGVPDIRYWGLVEPATAQANSYTQALRLLKYGFTSVRDISENGLYLKRAFNVPGVNGPRIVACGRGLNRTGGHCDGIHFNDLDFENKVNLIAHKADGEEQIRNKVRALIRQGADQIKFWATGGGHNPIDRYSDIHYTAEEMKAICDEAKLIEGMMVCAHCENPDITVQCIAAGADSIEHADGYSPEIADIMLEYETYLIPTMRLMEFWQKDYMTPNLQEYEIGKLGPFFQRDVDAIVDSPEEDAEEIRRIIEGFQDAVSRGVKIGMGSDTIWESMTPFGKYSVMELISMQKCGMTANQVITATTKVNAEVLGMGTVLGTVEEGKFADLLIVNQDPTQDIGIFLDVDVIEYVIRDGKLAMDHGKLVV